MTTNQNKIIEWTWRSGRQTVGIVAAEVGVGQWRGYIGVAQDVSEEYDAGFIRDWGAKLTESEARPFFPSMKDRPYANS